MPGSMT